MVSKQALWKQKQRNLRKELDATEWRIEPGGHFTQWSKNGAVGGSSVVAPVADTTDSTDYTDSTAPLLLSSSQSVIAEVTERWSAGPGSKSHPDIKARILAAAIQDMKVLLSSETKSPAGQDHANHMQVLEFMSMQVKNPERVRTESALRIANGWGKGRKMSLAIMRRERDWVRRRFIVPGRIGKVKPKKDGAVASEETRVDVGGDVDVEGEWARVDSGEGVENLNKSRRLNMGGDI